MQTGMNTFSSKLPWDAAMDTATSFAITCTATMVTCSHWVGFTFPGMMEEPGSFSGIVISPNPFRGPDASQRTSLAIFIRSQARAFMAPCAKTSSSLEVRAWNLLGSVRNSFPVREEMTRATSVSKPAGAFNPVPTAVPPSARCFSWGNAESSICLSRSRLLLQPEISCENRMGVASCRWVRPDLTTSAFSCSRCRNVAISKSIAGSNLSSMERTAAMCMAAGNVSLEDWDIFTSSLGCSSFFPSSSLPRFAITSLTFMLVWVPEPVCQTTRGK